MSTIFSKVLWAAAVTGALFSIFAYSHGQVLAIAPESELVGMTYYGGHYDPEQNKWIIDNTYQCDRIKTGEFSAEKLMATPTEDCDDDPGYGYFNYIPLHNTMSYAELSNPPSYSDYSALGNLPARTRLQVEYNGRCAILEKLDVGAGGYAVRGYRRSIDLWWETARSLGFINGFDVARVSYVDQNTPLTPLGQTSACQVTAPPQSPAADTEETEPGSDVETDDEAVIEGDKTSKGDRQESSDGGKKDEDQELMVSVGMAIIAILSALVLIFYPKKPRLRL